MRVTTAQFYERSAANYQRNFSKVLSTSEEASDFIRVRTGADDPVGAARLLQLGQQSSMLDQYKVNTSTIQNTLGQSEGVLKSIDLILQRANELAIGAGNASYTDAERKANANELGQLESQLLSLMNSRDENGQYLFSGSKGDTAPYSRNADGSYSYHGDQTTLELKVGDMLTMASNDTGFTIFEQALNTSRSQTVQTGGVVDNKVILSNGQVSGSSTYNDQFRSGEPYEIEFLSATQFKITDSSTPPQDVTIDATNSGTFKTDASGGATITFRGVDLKLNVTLQPGDVADSVVGLRKFSLGSTPDTLNTSRNPGNGSTSVISGSQVSNQADYGNAFPAAGAVLVFKNGGADFDLFATPMAAGARPVSSGTYDAVNKTATAAGVTFTFNSDPVDSDQFVVQPNNHQTQNILDTLSQLRVALETPIDGSLDAEKKFRAQLDSAIANIGSGKSQVLSTMTSIGARGAALDIQTTTNESLSIGNADTQSSIRDGDPAEILTRLTLQQTMLQASQLAFSKISQLGLFNKI